LKRQVTGVSAAADKVVDAGAIERELRGAAIEDNRAIEAGGREITGRDIAAKLSDEHSIVLYREVVADKKVDRVGRRGAQREKRGETGDGHILRASGRIDGERARGSIEAGQRYMTAGDGQRLDRGEIVDAEGDGVRVVDVERRRV